MADLTHQQEAVYETRLSRVHRGLWLANAVVVLAFFGGMYGTERGTSYLVAMAVGAAVLVNVCGIALRTALRPIPAGRTPTPTAPESDPDADTLLDEPEPPSVAVTAGEDVPEPAIYTEPVPATGPSLVEVEEVPTHPGLTPAPTLGSLADQDTEIDTDRTHLRNPEAPVLTVPRAGHRTPNPDDE